MTRSSRRSPWVTEPVLASRLPTASFASISVRSNARAPSVTGRDSLSNYRRWPCRRGLPYAGPGQHIVTGFSMRRNASILVIDDEEIMREILEALLTREGYQVRLASTGAEGIELAKSIPFDIAIVDLMMPGIDGMATLEELKKPMTSCRC